MTISALALSTQYFHSNMLKVLRDDGLITQDQIRRAVASAKAELESTGDPVGIRASVMLEPMVGRL